MVCLLEGRGEGERANEERRGEDRREERERGRAGRQENFSVVRSHGGRVCACVRAGAATMQVKTH